MKINKSIEVRIFDELGAEQSMVLVVDGRHQYGSTYVPNGFKAGIYFLSPAKATERHDRENVIKDAVIEAAKKYVQKDAIYLSTISNPPQVGLQKKAGIERDDAFAVLMSTLVRLKAVQDA